MHKAEDLRDRERVERIGKILASAISLQPSGDFDNAEEMMRVARDLGDGDVRMLATLSRINVAVSPDPTANDSVLLKLQGLGLARRLERQEKQGANPALWATEKATLRLPNNLPEFVLLPKGRDFIRYAKGTSPE